MWYDISTIGNKSSYVYYIINFSFCQEKDEAAQFYGLLLEKQHQATKLPDESIAQAPPSAILNLHFYRMRI